MKIRNKLLITSALLLIGIGVVPILASLPKRAMTQNQPNNSPSEERPERDRKSKPLFRLRPLTKDSQQEVGNAALAYTQDRFPVVSGTAKVAFTRPITAAELPATGLGEINFIAEEPPLMLVVVKGDFDVSSFVPQREGLNPPKRVKYIAYIFDLRAGIPTLTATGLTGAYFRGVLKDPSLPDEPKKLVEPEPGMPEAIPGPRLEPPAKKLPYGTTIPGEAPARR